MKIGVSLKSWQDRGSSRDGARVMVERAAAAWDAGLDSMFVGDHHVTGGPYYQNSPILGRLLAEWGDRPAGALYLIPLWNPVLVAEQVATLAAVAQGPFVLQCAVGGGDEQFAGMGADIGRRPSLFEHGLLAIRQLLAGERIDGTGPWGFEGAQIGPVPEEPVQVWIGAHVDVAIDRAARMGDAWLAGPSLTLDQARDQAATYDEACARHGRSPTVRPLRRDVVVAPSREEAEHLARPVLDAGYRGFDPSAPVVGSVDHVVEQFGRYGDLGYDHILIRHMVDDQAAVLRSFELLGEVRRQLT